MKDRIILDSYTSETFVASSRERERDQLDESAYVACRECRNDATVRLLMMRADHMRVPRPWR